MPPSPPPTFVTPVDVPGIVINEALAEEGKSHFASNCTFCHGAGTVSGGYAPDLRASPATMDEVAFKEVVRTGRLPMGMPRYPDTSDREIRALFHYIRQQARESLKEDATESGS